MNFLNRLLVFVFSVVFFSEVCSAESIQYFCQFRGDSTVPPIQDEFVSGSVALRSCGRTPQGLKILTPERQGCVPQSPLQVGSPLVLWERGTPGTPSYNRLATGFWVAHASGYRLCGMFADLQSFAPLGALTNAGNVSRPELGCNSNYVTLKPKTDFTFYGSGGTNYVQCTIALMP